MDTMKFENPQAHITRFCIFILLSLTCAVPVKTKCDDYGIKNAADDGSGDWHFYNFDGRCSICFRRTSSSQKAELILPCMDQNQQRINQIKIWYRYYDHEGTPRRQPLSQYKMTNGKACEVNYSSGTQLQRDDDAPLDMTEDEDDRWREVGKPVIIRQREDYSYRLKMIQDVSVSLICLTKVEFEQKQKQNNFPIWVVFVIIAIVIISICAVVGVFVCRRKRHDHQSAKKMNTGRQNGESNGITDNMRNDGDVIPNPTYGQESVKEKEEEYHSYTEIDVKVPDNSEMIYNSAYESPPARSDMVYNCAYESRETNSDDSAAESSP